MKKGLRTTKSISVFSRDGYWSGNKGRTIERKRRQSMHSVCLEKMLVGDIREIKSPTLFVRKKDLNRLSTLLRDPQKAQLQNGGHVTWNLL